MTLVVHLRNLWGNWWLVPALPLLGLAFVAAMGDLRSEHAVIVGIIVALAVASTTTKELLIACLPGIGIGFGYELVRYLRPLFVTPNRVWSCELRTIDMAFSPLGQDQTLPEFFSQHHAPVWDVFFALPYTLFWVIALVYGLALFFLNRPRMDRFLWVLALTHAVAFVIWMVLPAAPPWYVQTYGCSIQIDALPSAAALLRMDALLGIDYYANFYSRAPTVFGALPSLHCAFPAAGLATAWRDAGWPERFAHLGYTAWMLAASVYLGHHWLLDGVLGILIVLLVCFAVDRFLSRSESRASGLPRTT